jgi:hypothetical protein
MRQRFLGYFLVGIFSCLALVGIASPSLSFNIFNQSFNQNSANSQNYIQLASSVLIAQGGDRSKFVSYSASLDGIAIAPSSVSTSAIGEAGAVSIGDRLVVRGGFRNLSSQLSYYSPDPLITSAIHLHQGAANENGPLQYALQVNLEPNQLDGTFGGNYKLTENQIQALTSGKLYITLHTSINRAGEIRGAFKPYST